MGQKKSVFFLREAPPVLYYDLNENLTRNNLVVSVIFRIFVAVRRITNKLPFKCPVNLQD